MLCHPKCMYDKLTRSRYNFHTLENKYLLIQNRKIKSAALKQLLQIYIGIYLYFIICCIGKKTILLSCCICIHIGTTQKNKDKG